MAKGEQKWEGEKDLPLDPASLEDALRVHGAIAADPDQPQYVRKLSQVVIGAVKGYLKELTALIDEEEKALYPRFSLKGEL